MPSTSLYLALPRLHRELVCPKEAHLPPPPGEIRTLWPGLPGPLPSWGWTPAYAWTPAQALACMAAFEQAGRDGASGAPVQALTLESMAPGDLSPAETEALKEFRGSGPSSLDVEPLDRWLSAQRALLLAWLQETQVMELLRLERKIGEKQAVLANLLGDGEAEDVPAAGGLPQSGVTGLARAEVPLPAWDVVLAAASVFLPAHDVCVVVTDKAMAEALAECGTPQPDAPDGYVMVRAPLWLTLGLPQPSEAKEAISFLLPKVWVESFPA